VILFIVPWLAALRPCAAKSKETGVAGTAITWEAKKYAWMRNSLVLRFVDLPDSWERYDFESVGESGLPACRP
jgi:hypothetical protein